MPRKPAAPPKPAPRSRSGGKPEHVPTDLARARVEVWSGGGIEQAHIAASLGISRPTLVKHYKAELAVGRSKMDGLAVSTLALAMQRGGKEAVAAAKWWTMSRMGWTEKLQVDDGKLADTPMRVIIELVGDPPAERHDTTARTRPGFDPSLVQLVG